MEERHEPRGGDHTDGEHRGLTCRTFLVEGTGIIAAGALGASLRSPRRLSRRTLALTEPRASQAEALRVLGRSTMRVPGSGDTAAALACSTSGPGTIPPPSPPPIPLRVEMRNLGISRRARGLELELWTTRSTLEGVAVELH
jgi:hypothetical protein